MRYQVTYKVGKKTYVNDSAYVSFKVISDYKLEIIPSRDIELVSAKVFYEYDDSSQFFCNGFQTWTDSGLYYKNQKMPHLKPLAKLTDAFFKFSTVNDINWCEQDKHFSHTYTYLLKNGKVIFYGALNERTGFTTFHFKKDLEVHKDVEGVIISSPFIVFDIYKDQGDLLTCLDNYFTLLGVNKPTAPIMDGYTSWYKHYTDLSEEKLRRDLEGFKKVSWFKPSLFQIDDGYEEYVGDWMRVDKVKFPSGLQGIVDDIVKSHMMPGIWLAPFICEKKSNLMKEHPSWVIDKGAFNWSGIYHLDVTNPEVKEYLHQVFTYFKKLGFKFFKLDFLYSAGYRPMNDKSRGQIMYESMDFLREELKGCYILGCGVPLGSAFGKVDYCRISTDVTENNDGPWYLRLLHRERKSTKMAIQDTIARSHLNGRAFNNDPDVFFLRETKLSDKYKEALFKANLENGNLLLTSDDVSKYSPENMDKLRKVQDKVLNSQELSKTLFK